MPSPFSNKESNTKSREKRQRIVKEERPPLITKSQVFKLGLFLSFILLLVSICFVGQFPFALEVLTNQVSKIRIVADHPFSYQSDILTKRKQERLGQQIAPVYRIDESQFLHFQKDITGLVTKLDTLQAELKALKPEDKKAALENFTAAFEKDTKIYLNPDDIAYILDKTDVTQRKRIFDEGLIMLKDITREGIRESLDLDIPAPYLYSVELEGHQGEVKIKNEKDALRYLSLNLVALDIEWPLARAVFRVLKNGIHPNLTFDSNKTDEKIKKALAALTPVIVPVESGQTIIEPGSVIGPEQSEQLRAYRNFLQENEDLGFGFNVTLRERLFLTIVILFAGILYVKVAMPEVLKSNKRLSLCALIVAGNLLAIRLLLEIGNIDFLNNIPNLLSVLPFICPIALGPILATILLGPRPAIIISALISTFYALMLGSVTSFLLIALISSLVGIYFSQSIRLRNHIVRAAAFTGIVSAFCALLLGSFNAIPITTLSYQMVFALLTGALTGVAAIGILPILEKLFKITTDITLLELTDYNHPLLRRLQLETPGTYHHSLMVANIAERAASEIPANPLICRVCSLYHDIGKTTKPEYFVENQSSGTNPHYDRNPSMSALVIKSHVKEGLAIAKKYKLPKIIMDVIEQHHGTTLIQYFYDKAIKQKTQVELPFAEDSSSDDTTEVDESTFRYDGPKPQFKESAIIFFADSLEAASRALNKPSASKIEELVNHIFKEKLDDNQLDECPLTMAEMHLIKKSFTRSLINMLHARIQYPEKDSSKPNLSSITEHETNA